MEKEPQTTNVRNVVEVSALLQRLQPTETPASPDDVTQMQAAIAAECDALKALLLEKNKAYGNSALDPLRVFSRASSEEQLRVRIDDKLSRLARGHALPDESLDQTVVDLMGYLVLLRVKRRVLGPIDPLSVMALQLNGPAAPQVRADIDRAVAALREVVARLHGADAVMDLRQEGDEAVLWITRNGELLFRGNLSVANCRHRMGKILTQWVRRVGDEESYDYWQAAFLRMQTAYFDLHGEKRVFSRKMSDRGPPLECIASFACPDAGATETAGESTRMEHMLVHRGAKALDVARAFEASMHSQSAPSAAPQAAAPDPVAIEARERDKAVQALREEAERLAGLYLQEPHGVSLSIDRKDGRFAVHVAPWLSPAHGLGDHGMDRQVAWGKPYAKDDGAFLLSVMDRLSLRSPSGDAEIDAAMSRSVVLMLDEIGRWYQRFYKRNRAEVSVAREDNCWQLQVRVDDEDRAMSFSESVPTNAQTIAGFVKARLRAMAPENPLLTEKGMTEALAADDAERELRWLLRPIAIGKIEWRRTVALKNWALEFTHGPSPRYSVHYEFDGSLDRHFALQQAIKRVRENLGSELADARP